MLVILGISFVFLFLGLFVSVVLIPEGVEQFIALFVVCVLFMIPAFYAIKLEISVGVYRCKGCGFEIVPAYSDVLKTKHRGFTRYLFCEKCNKHTWCKKVLK